MVPLREHKALWRGLLAVYAVLFVAALEVLPDFNEMLELVVMPPEVRMRPSSAVRRCCLVWAGVTSCRHGAAACLLHLQLKWTLVGLMFVDTAAVWVWETALRAVLA